MRSFSHSWHSGPLSYLVSPCSDITTQTLPLTSGSHQAQTGGLCSQPTITINAAADATNIPCQTVNTIVINNGVIGQININGPLAVTGDIIVNNVTQLVSLSSSSIGSIAGSFTMQGLTLLSTLSFTALTSVKDITWKTLPALQTLTFGTVGITKVSTIQISDTFLSSLDGLNVASVDSFSLDNNKRLVTYTSSLTNVSTLLSITANGANLTINAPSLVWAKVLQVQNVGSISLPALKVINDSLKFDKNDFATFNAPNLTSTTTGDISFINNPSLTNITMPVLQKTGGGFTIQNNTNLMVLNSFPKLSQVGGAVIIRGNFTE
jgi:hypothetical protein